MVVAKEENITKAAHLLHMTQPPLSHMLKVFEQELGVTLLKKSGRNIQLTEQGCALRDRGKFLLEMAAQTVQELHKLTSNVQEIGIGNATPWAKTILPPRLRFSTSLSYNSIRLWQGDSHHIMDLLKTGVIELGFVTMRTDPVKYESRLLNIEWLYAFFNPKFDVGQSKEEITLIELASTPLILHQDLHDLFQAYYKHEGLTAQLLFQHNDIDSLLDYPFDKSCALIGPKSIFDIHRREDLKCKLIVNPPVGLTSYIVWQRNHTLSKAASNFIDMILADFQPLDKNELSEIDQIINNPDRIKKRIIF